MISPFQLLIPFKIYFQTLSYLQLNWQSLWFKLQGKKKNLLYQSICLTPFIYKNMQNILWHLMVGEQG